MEGNAKKRIHEVSLVLEDRHGHRWVDEAWRFWSANEAIGQFLHVLPGKVERRFSYVHFYYKAVAKAELRLLDDDGRTVRKTVIPNPWAERMNER